MSTYLLMDYYNLDNENLIDAIEDDIYPNSYETLVDVAKTLRYRYNINSDEAWNVAKAILQRYQKMDFSSCKIRFCNCAINSRFNSIKDIAQIVYNATKHLEDYPDKNWKSAEIIVSHITCDQT